jgi:hypothetical protein
MWLIENSASKFEGRLSPTSAPAEKGMVDGSFTSLHSTEAVDSRPGLLHSRKLGDHRPGAAQAMYSSR